MAGYDRVIDPLTGDYVDDGAGGFEQTTSARTEIYHQLHTPRGSWWGDPDAGSRLHELDKSSEAAALEVEDIALEAMHPLVEAGRISAPSVTVEREVDRMGVTVITHDLQSDETVDVTSEIIKVNV